MHVGRRPSSPRTSKTCPKSCHSCIVTIMGAINGIEWSIKAASKGTLWVHVIGRAQTSVYMGVSWAINPGWVCLGGVCTLPSCITTIMGAINGIEWNIKAASKGTLWVHVIGRAQASVYMGVSWAINPRNQCWFGFWALTGSTIPKLGFLSHESQDTSQSSGHHPKSDPGSYLSWLEWFKRMERAHMAQIPNLMPPQQLGNPSPQIVLWPRPIGSRLYPVSPTGPQPRVWASLRKVSRCPGSGAFMWVVVFCVSMAVQRAAAAKIWVQGTLPQPPRGTQLELAADLGLILTEIGAV